MFDTDFAETPTPNVAELDALLAWAEAEHVKKEEGKPSEWDQGSWAAVNRAVDCGTACCIAGKAVAREGGQFLMPEGTPYAIMAVLPSGEEVRIEDEARVRLGLTYEQAEALFCPDNSIEDVRRIIEAIKDGDPEPEYDGNDDY